MQNKSTLNNINHTSCEGFGTLSMMKQPGGTVIKILCIEFELNINKNDIILQFVTTQPFTHQVESPDQIRN